RVIEGDPESRVHAANNVILGRLPDPCRRIGILPGEILVHELDDCLCDDPGFASALNRYLYLFRYLDCVDFPRSLVERPQVAVDANLRHHALVDAINRTHLVRTWLDINHTHVDRTWLD